MSTLPFQGGVIFRTFVPDSGFGTYANVDRHGNFTLKQLRLPVLNETHTNSYTGPRLSTLGTIIGHSLTFNTGGGGDFNYNAKCCTIFDYDCKTSLQLSLNNILYR
jgi:hypothetical protein